MMELNEDFYKQFFLLLNEFKVRYILIGGFAVNLHGYSRYTGDLDIWCEPNMGNSERLISAIEKFGFETQILKSKNLLNENPIKLNDGLLKIEILPNIAGDFTFEEAYKRSFEIEVDKFHIRLISYQDLINNKERSMRMKDATDVYYLKEIRKIQDREKNK
jgi:predicted nucleotidyltransferase